LNPRSDVLASTVVKPTEESKEDLTLFDTGNRNTLRPIIYRPNGSFRTLKETGKMSCETDEADVYKGRRRNPLANTQFELPGYTGFVRGRQNISGRTFGQTTRHAHTADYRAVACQSPIPSSPQANRKIPQEKMENSFLHKVFGERDYRIPGYTGFVPHVRQTLGCSYGNATSASLKTHAQEFPQPDNSQEGFAKTAVPRQERPLDSNPLPGGSLTHSSPDMFVPAHIKYLRYIPQ
jgi:hypothetical protein